MRLKITKPVEVLSFIKQAHSATGVSARDIARKLGGDPAIYMRALAREVRLHPGKIRSFFRRYNDGKGFPSQEMAYSWGKNSDDPVAERGSRKRLTMSRADKPARDGATSGSVGIGLARPLAPKRLVLRK